MLTVEDVNENLLNYLPHRFPFLFVDKVLNFSVNPDNTGKLKAIKNVTRNEHVFQGHFPDNPIYPGVMTIEGLAQSSTILSSIGRRINDNNSEPTLVFFAGIDSAKFKRPIKPGDTVIYEVEVVKVKRGMQIAEVKATVDGNVSVEAVLKAMVIK